jgi:hypothetical protein
MKSNLLAARVLLLIAGVLVFPRNVGACTCVPDRPPFLEAAAAAPLVVRGLVTRHHGHWGVFSGMRKYLDLEVREVLKGSYDSKLLVIIGGNGHQCRHNVSQFRVGSEWVLVLTPASESSRRRAVFQVSRCSESSLGVVNGQVGGELSRSAGGHLQSVGLPELRSLLQNSATPGGV